MEYLGIQEYTANNGRTFSTPTFDTMGFINTVKGWNLYAKCSKEKTMHIYRAAKAEYNQAHNIRPCPEWHKLVDEHDQRRRASHE